MQRAIRTQDVAEEVSQEGVVQQQRGDPTAPRLAPSSGSWGPERAPKVEKQESKEAQMRIRIKRKKLTLVVSGIAVLALAGAALAYWTASGSGSGDATAGTDSGVTITNVTFDATLYPAATVNVKYDVNNSSADTQ